MFKEYASAAKFCAQPQAGSHTGNAKLIAEKIAEEFSGDTVDIKQIETEKTYPEYGDELRDQAKKKRVGR